MTVIIPNAEPIEITAGDYIQWQKSVDGYLASAGWTLSYAFLNSTSKFSVTADQSGDDFLVTIAAATSAAFTAGVYKWQSYVTNGSQRVTISDGQICVKPNYAAQSILETRSQAKQILDALEAAIATIASGGLVQEYTIQGRSLKKMPVTDMIILRDKYRTIYNSEQNAERIKNGLQGKNRVLVRI